MRGEYQQSGFCLHYGDLALGWNPWLGATWRWTILFCSEMITLPTLVELEYMWIVKYLANDFPNTDTSVSHLGIVYHPPRANAADDNNLYNHVQSVVDNFLRTHPDCLLWIFGDFNSNSTNISDCYFKRAIGLTQIVKVLTRDTGILDWCLIGGV